MHNPQAILTLALVAGLTSCAGMPAIHTNSTSAPVQGVTLKGKVQGGQQPVQGASVYLFAAGTGGYGNGSISLLTSNVTTQSPPGGKDGSGNWYATTDSHGGFTFTGDFTCPSGSQVYAYAVGGDSGGGPNPAIGLMAAAGPCSSLDSSTFIFMDEVSTIATAYALAGYATDPTHISSSGSSLAQTGVANAFATVTNLETLSTGLSLATTPAGNGAVPQSEINTLADILAGCVNSSGLSSTGCTTLFSNAMNGSTAPTDTGAAAINIAHNPGTNISALYALASASAPFQPTLSTAPNDFTISINYTGGGMNGTLPVAIDKSGNIWIGNTATGANSVTELNPLGAPISGSSGYTGGGVDDPYSIAIDSSGDLWATDYSTSALSELSSSGVPISGSSGFTGGGLELPDGIEFDGNGHLWVANALGTKISEFTSAGSPISSSSGITGGGINAPTGVAVDTSGNIWFTNVTSTLTEFNPSGTPSANSPITIGSAFGPVGVNIDGLGNVWTVNFHENSLSEFNSAGMLLSPASGYTGGGLNGPKYMAIDGAGNLWAANRNSIGISEFTSSGKAITGSGGYQNSALNDLPEGIAVDGSGNVWVTNPGTSTTVGNNIVEFVGAAYPVATPIVANLMPPYSSHAVNLP